MLLNFIDFWPIGGIGYPVWSLMHSLLYEWQILTVLVTELPGPGVNLVAAELLVQKLVVLEARTMLLGPVGQLCPVSALSDLTNAGLGSA